MFVQLLLVNIHYLLFSKSGFTKVVLFIGVHDFCFTLISYFGSSNYALSQTYVLAKIVVCQKGKNLIKLLNAKCNTVIH